jgi:EmrB/QacA subfamily drug resistance transporter
LGVINQLKDKSQLALITMAAGMFLWSYSAGLVNISLPIIAQFLDVSISTVSWIIIAHLLVLISLLLVFGRISEIWGQKRVFMLGVSIFTLSSYLSGLAIDYYSLIIIRLVQGVGSAMLLSVAPALISQVTRHRERGQSFGYISIATTIGLSLGYLTGGVVIDNFSWNYIFFLVVPIGVIVLIIAHKSLDNKIQSKENKKFDLLGSGLLFVIFSLLIISFEIIGDPYLPIIEGIGMCLVALLAIIIFIFWELRHPHPLLDLRLLKNRYLTLAVITAFLTTMVLTGTIFLVPFYLEMVKEYHSTFAGMIIFASTLLVLVASPISGRLSDRFGSKKLNITGGLLLVGALILMTLMNGAVGLVFIFTVLSIRALSDGVANPANSKMVMSHSTNESLSTVSSLLNTARYFGLVAGVVIFETIFDASISSQAITLEGSKTGALELSLPAGVLEHGFQTTFYLGVAIAIIVIILTFLSEENKENI